MRKAIITHSLFGLITRCTDANSTYFDVQPLKFKPNCNCSTLLHKGENSFPPKCNYSHKWYAALEPRTTSLKLIKAPVCALPPLCSLCTFTIYIILKQDWQWLLHVRTCKFVERGGSYTEYKNIFFFKNSNASEFTHSKTLQVLWKCRLPTGNVWKRALDARMLINMPFIVNTFVTVLRRRGNIKRTSSDEFL